MNLFPECELKSKDQIYQSWIDKKLIKQYSDYVKIRSEVRNKIKYLDGLKLEIAEQILITEKSNDLKVRKAYYKRIFELYNQFNKIT